MNRTVGVVSSVSWLLVGAAAGLVVVVFGLAGAHVVRETHVRPAAELAATAWVAGLPLVAPLVPGTRPVKLVQVGDPSAVCVLSGRPAPTPGELCSVDGLTFGSVPRLVSFDPYGRGRYAALFSYRDGWDDSPTKWLAVSVVRVGDGWLVDRFADVPLSSEPGLETVWGVLDHTDRVSR